MFGEPSITVFLLSISVTPLVKKPPEVFVSPTNQSVFEGEKVKFHCKAIGIPTPTISWIRKGSELPDTAVQAEPGILKIESAMSGDEGLYVCTARNSEGSETASVKLEVQGKIFDQSLRTLERN